MRLRSLCISVILALRASQPGLAQYAQGACTPTSDSLRTADSARVAPGTYAVVLVATVGPRAGAGVEGSLTLRPTRTTDRSPHTGQGPARTENRAHVPLWGTFAGDLGRVGAPLPDIGDRYSPQPDSDDPIFPGVLVLIQNWQNPALLRQNMLWVATGSNDRADVDYATVDGPGIVMNVRRLDGTAFSGTWGPAGRSRVGGYFCAQLLAPR